jgi:hypothetical protein
MPLWRHPSRNRDLEAALRDARPRPSDHLLQSIAHRVEGAAPRRRTASFRIAAAGSLSAALLIALAAVGGVGYAASSVTHVVRTLEKVAFPASHAKSAAHRQAPAAQPPRATAAADQYRPPPNSTRIFTAAARNAGALADAAFTRAANAIVSHLLDDAARCGANAACLRGVIARAVSQIRAAAQHQIALLQAREAAALARCHATQGCNATLVARSYNNAIARLRGLEDRTIKHAELVLTNAAKKH